MIDSYDVEDPEDGHFRSSVRERKRIQERRDKEVAMEGFGKSTTPGFTMKHIKKEKPYLKHKKVSRFVPSLHKTFQEE